MFSLTFTRVSEERERDLIRFNSFLLEWNPNKQTNKQTNPKFKERQKEKSQTNFFFMLFYTRALV